MTGLDDEDPMIGPHAEVKKFKTQNKVAAVLKGGERFKNVAEAIKGGGYFT